MQALAAPRWSHSPGGRATRPRIASFGVRLLIAIVLLLATPRLATSSSSLSPPSSSSSSSSSSNSAPCSLENFEAFCLEFHKDYSANPQELARRFEAWTKSCLFLENYKVEHPDASFHMAYNPLSDRLPEEHEAMFGYKVKPRARREPSSSAAFDSNNNNTTRRGLQGFHKRDRSEDKDAKDEEGDDAYPVPPEWAKELKPQSLPAAVDWRVAKLNPDNVVAVTPVKNQAACGACWAFTTAAAVEGAVAVTTKVLNELSNQELIDCVTQNQGCNGGDFDYAFQFVVKKGLVSSSDYKFTQNQGTCRASQFAIASKIAAAYETDACSKNGLMNIVARRPVAVAIDGSCEAFVQYRGGIYTQSCGNDLNHAVTIVGYGTDEKTGTDYWIIKNSWGKYWGSAGYGLIARGVGNCGVSNIEEYGYYAAGGIAYVNGTGFFSDDALAEDPNVGFFDKILQWKYLSYVLGAAIFLLALPLIMSFFRALRRCCCGPPAGGRGGQQMGSPNGAAAAMVVPLGSGGGGGRTPPSRSPGGGRGPPPRPPPRSPPRSLPLPPPPPPTVPGTAAMASEWSCPACTFFNAPHRRMCQICGQQRK